jgi:hypothetical protein
VSDSRQDQFFDVRDNFIKGFAILGWGSWQPRPYLAWLYLGEDWKLFDILVVIGDPIDHFSTKPAELIRGHVEVVFFT